jgi:hypothetical protein
MKNIVTSSILVLLLIEIRAQDSILHFGFSGGLASSLLYVETNQTTFNDALGEPLWSPTFGICGLAQLKQSIHVQAGLYYVQKGSHRTIYFDPDNTKHFYRIPDRYRMMVGHVGLRTATSEHRKLYIGIEGTYSFVINYSSINEQLTTLLPPNATIQDLKSIQLATIGAGFNLGYRTGDRAEVNLHAGYDFTSLFTTQLFRGNVATAVISFRFYPIQVGEGSGKNIERLEIGR